MPSSSSLYFKNYLPVTGCKNQKVFDRLPVQELEASHPYQWTLFILAWAYIKETPIPLPGVVHPPLSPSVSLMEIGAIHGRPYREWPGDLRTPEEAQVDYNPNDKKDTNPSPARFGGYCHHAVVTFPSWHRPYMMLLEQAIGEYAENIAQQIENSHPGEVGRWVEEAKQLRFPYWDWADPKVDIEGLPSLFFTDELKIMGFGNKYMDVPNPLVCFTFPYIPSDFEDQQRKSVTAHFTKWQKTLRYATDTSNTSGSNIQALQSNLKEQAKSIRTSIGMLFTHTDNGDSALIYDEFSNTLNQSRQEGDDNHTGSLEAVHNSMHGHLGGNGHMAYPDYAGFDPLFFFHHCNVDRLVALWEWCYPEYWLGDGYTIDKQPHKWTMKQGTYSAAYSQMIEEDGEWGMLVPWRHPDGTYWTSKETRFLTPNAFPKHYSYKEFLGIKVDKEATSLKERQEARARIAKYYNVDPQKAAQSIHLPSWQHIPVPDAAKLPAKYVPIKNFRIFKVLVRLSEHAIGASYHLYLYFKTELVGSITVFARGDSSPCKACKVRREADSIVRGVITIPDRIINDIIVHSSIPSGQKTMNKTVDLVKHALSAKLVDVSGHVIASAQGGKTVVRVPAGQAAPRAIHPAEVTLLSAAVAEDVNDAAQPVHFFDFANHGELFSSGWKASSTLAAVATTTPVAAH